MRRRSSFRRRLIPAVAAVLCASAGIAATAQAATPIGSYVRTGAWRYVSQPKLAPPKIKVLKSAKRGQLAPGYFLISNFKNLGITSSNGSPVPMTGQGGPIIYDSKMQPVWIHGVPDNLYSLNFRTQTYKGKPALSWWEGVVTPTGATVSGTDYVANQNYKIVAKLTGQDGWVFSPHEFVITGGHFAWVTAYKNIPMNLAPYGGVINGTLTDTAVQEYDLNTGQLVYSWDALKHILLSKSETKPPPPTNPAAASTGWDAYHLNAIQPLSGGRFLASMRNMWAAYLVDQSTGNIIWTLGGKASTFKIPANAAFQWQHDVQLQPNGQISMFDNGCCGFGAKGFLPPNGPTRGLVLNVDTAARAVTLAEQYSLPGVAVGSQGDTQLLPNGNVLVGFGQQPYFAEYTEAGKLLFEAQLPSPDESYRAFAERWTGKPLYGPSAAAQKKGRRTTVYASWNGATNVARWRVLAGHDAHHLAIVATKARTGFETTIRLKSSYGAYKVVALDSRRHVLRRSGVFHASKPKAHHPPPGGFY
jgi:Arylsulfotransferase (ASST)